MKQPQVEIELVEGCCYCCDIMTGGGVGRPLAYGMSCMGAVKAAHAVLSVVSVTLNPILYTLQHLELGGGFVQTTPRLPIAGRLPPPL